jgi:Peptidase family C25/Propeptide_C25/FlgD Ig-like domain/Carboxypeptidase regulatory-like domain
MHQWRLVTFFALISMLFGLSVLASDSDKIIPLSTEQSLDETTVVLSEKSVIGLTLQFRTPYLEISEQDMDSGKFHMIGLAGADMVGTDGKPELPLITRMVAIPDGQTLRIKNIESRNTAIEGSYRPVPGQGLKDISDKSFKIDREYYNGSKGLDSSELVTVGSPGLIRGLRIVPVRFRPVSWTPTDGKLDVAQEIDVTFEWVPSSDGNDGRLQGALVPESFATMYETEVIGFQRDGGVMQGPGSYLLIHPNDATVLSNLQPLISWRQRQGYNVVVASTAQTGTSTSSIKSFIQNQYDTLSIPLEFVSLVGDANGAVSLPTYNENLSSYGGEGDHEYTLLAGDDVLSDVHIGRISVTSTDMLAAMVTKIVEYESNPYMGDDLEWFTRAGLAGDPGTSGYSCVWVNQWVKQQLLELNYTRVDTIWSGNFATLMYETVNRGESIFTYRGYYNMSGMGAGYIDALANKEKLPFALILTCDTGSFQSDVACRSESFFRNANGGAIASIGTATIGTHTRYNNCMFQGVAQGVLNSGDPRVGPGLTMGKLHLYQNYIDVEPDNVTVWSTWNNLMGDPATALWSALPSVLTVDYPANLTAGTNSLPVLVQDAGVPRAGALVTVFREGVIQVSSVTGSNGQVHLPLSGLVDGEYLVTVTGRNLKPYLGGFNVGDLPVSVNYFAHGVDDDNIGASQGNGDGLANPGETLELLVDLVNNGTGGVSDISADIAALNELVSVNQGSADFGYIGSGSTVSGQQNYVIHLDPALAGGSSIALDMVAGDGSETWNSLVNLTVHGPAAEVQGFSLNSGTINPGESSNLAVILGNVGNLGTSGVTATLSSNSLWVTVGDDNGSFGAISPGGSGTNSGNPFSISAGVECYPGTVANLTLDLVFDEGGTASLPFLVTIGSAVSTDPAGPDRHGYFAFDNTDLGYPLAPVYDWVEISPESGGSGVSVGLTDYDRFEDDVVIMDMPFPFTYYGKTFTKMSVCSNGWISMGGTDLRHYRNWTLPSPGTPDNLIAVYWDDLKIQASNSGVFYWHDEANHRFIIQWDNLANSWTGVVETFQVILQDPAYGAGDTGDGVITMNYQDVNPTHSETGYATVGIQNEDRDDAVLYTYFNLYPGGAAPVTDNRSITFRTVIPQAQGTLRGTVTNVANGGPVQGATVNILGYGLSLMSSETGQYQTGLTVGTYDVAVHHPSFGPDTTFAVVILEAADTVVDFALNDVSGPTFEMLAIPETTTDLVGPYDVVFKVSDFSGIQATHCYYTSSSSGGPFELLPLAEGPVDTWRVSIPGQPDGTLVQYWMTSTDMLAFPSTEPANAPANVHSFGIVQNTTVLYSSTMENASDWTGGLAGDTATTGVWENVDPNGVFENSDEISPEDDNSLAGTMCWITGQDPVGASQGNNDVDGGGTTLASPVIDIAGYGGLEVEYHRWYTNDSGLNPNSDNWVVQVLAQDGSWVDLENTSVTNRSWQQMNFILADHLTLGNNVQFRFVASDLGLGSVIEAGVDDFILTSLPILTDSENPEVTLLTPVGGESFAFASTVKIDWNQSDDIGVVHVEILLSTDGGATYAETIAEGPFNGSYSWELASPPGEENRVKVICHDSAGNWTEAVSAADFIITDTSGVGDMPTGRLVLAQNAPNPFNPRTEIKFSIPSSQDVTLRIYNVEGRLVRTLLQGRQEAGAHAVMWSGRDEQGGTVASGLYFYRLITDAGTLTRKMTLLK